MKGYLCLILIAVLFIAACTRNIKPGELYGKWNYIRVENPKNAEESLSEQEVAEQAPYIEFSENGSLVIMWGGKKLSSGKFKMEGDIIRYTESLPGGVKRPIPFAVKKLTADELVFETLEQDYTRITARRTK